MGTRVHQSAGAAPPTSAWSTSRVDAPKVSKDPFLLILGQSQDYPVQIESSRETSTASSTASTWVNLDSDVSRQEWLGNGGSASHPTDLQAKNKQLEKTVTSLQAQLTP